jgi:hypothetical protein
MLLQLPIDDPKKAVLETCGRPAVQALNSFLAGTGITTRPELDKRSRRGRAENWPSRGSLSETRLAYCRGLKKPVRVLYRVPAYLVDLSWLDRQARTWLDTCGLYVDKVSFGVVGTEWRFGFELEETPDVLFALGDPQVPVKSTTSRCAKVRRGRGRR